MEHLSEYLSLTPSRESNYPGVMGRQAKSSGAFPRRWGRFLILCISLPWRGLVLQAEVTKGFEGEFELNRGDATKQLHEYRASQDTPRDVESSESYPEPACGLDSFQPQITPQGGCEPIPFPDGAVDLCAYMSTEQDGEEVKKMLGARRYRDSADRVQEHHPSIPIEDRVALRIYTKIWPFSAWHSSAMNAALRSRSPADLRRLAPLIKAAASALRQLPPYTGRVYRGAPIPQEELKNYRKGMVVTEPVFLSTTKSKLKARLFSQIGGVLFIIESKRLGKSLGRLALSPDEEEVLFPPGAKFEVTSQCEPKWLSWARLKIVQMREY